MKILIDINHPAHVHFFKNLIWELQKKGHKVLVTTTTKDINEYLLDKYNIDYINLGHYRSGLFLKFIDFLIVSLKFLFYCYKNKPDYILSISSARPFGVLVSHAKFFVFTDTEHAKEQIVLFKPFATKIFTSEFFLNNLGPKQVRYLGYHQSACLHPNRFTPNPEVLKEIGITEKEKFFIVRFVAWEATHDIGQKGLTLKDKKQLIETLKPYGKIIISSEQKLPEEFEEYRMKICPTKMHDLLYYAYMFIGESSTMASEANCLNTPAILIYPQNYINMMCGVELVRKNKGVYFIYNQDEMMKVQMQCKLLLEDKVYYENWKQTNSLLLKENIDLTSFIIDSIEKEQ